MGSFATLHLGPYEFSSSKNYINPEYCEIFAAGDRRPRGRWRRTRGRAEYRATVSTARRRLDVLGYTLSHARARFEESIKEAIEGGFIRTRSHQIAPTPLKTLSFERWVQGFRYVVKQGLHSWGDHPAAPKSLANVVSWILYSEDTTYGFPDGDLLPLRVALDFFDDDVVVRVDLHDLFAGGWIDGRDDLVGAKEKVIVMTEGRSDASHLARAMNVLHPEMVDYFHFFDFGLKVNGGAPALVQLLKQFAAAGIKERVVAVFDNDSAARDAMRALNGVSLPATYRVLRLPPSQLAASYPTLGPTGVVTMDVNELAASLELFFPPEVLRVSDGSLTPVHWRGYVDGVRAYQGDLLDKNGVQQRMTKLLDDVEQGRRKAYKVDFAGMKQVLHALFSAFLP